MSRTCNYSVVKWWTSEMVWASFVAFFRYRHFPEVIVVYVYMLTKVDQIVHFCVSNYNRSYLNSKTANTTCTDYLSVLWMYSYFLDLIMEGMMHALKWNLNQTIVKLVADSREHFEISWNVSQFPWSWPHAHLVLTLPYYVPVEYKTKEPRRRSLRIQF